MEANNMEASSVDESNFEEPKNKPEVSSVQEMGSVCIRSLVTWCG